MTGRGEFIKRGLNAGLDKALSVQQPAIDAYLRRARANKPSLTPAEVLKSLEKQYLAAVTTMGALAGAAAAVPGVNIGPGLAANVVEVGAYLEASALYCLAVSQVYGLPVEDPGRRRALVLAILLGESGSTLVQKAAGRTGPYWAKSLRRFRDFARNRWPLRGSSSASQSMSLRFRAWLMSSAPGTAIC